MLIAPSQPASHGVEEYAIGNESERRDREHDGEHRWIEPGIAVKPDEIAEAALPDQELGCDHQDERGGECAANAGQNVGNCRREYDFQSTWRRVAPRLKADQVKASSTPRAPL